MATSEIEFYLSHCTVTPNDTTIENGVHSWTFTADEGYIFDKTGGIENPNTGDVGTQIPATNTNVTYLKDYNVTDDTIKNLPRISQLTSNNYSSSYLNPDHVEDVKSFISNNSASNMIYNFRYDCADYYGVGLRSWKLDSNAQDTYGVGQAIDTKLSFIHNFDIIELTFNKDGTFMVIPVVSNPTSVFPKIESPITDFFPNWLKSILFTIFGVVVLILIIWLISKLIKWFSKFVKWLKKKK